MVSEGLLVLTAELAVAIAGFSSVVVAVGSRPVAEWTPGEQRNLRILLQVSGLAILASLLPLILRLGIDTPRLWNVALAVYGVAHVIDVATFLLRPVRGESQIPPILGLVIALACIAVAAFGSALAAEIAYLAQLVWHLVIAGMGFAILIFRRQGSST